MAINTLYETHEMKPRHPVRLTVLDKDLPKQKNYSDTSLYDGIPAGDILSNLAQRKTEMESGRPDPGRWQDFLDQYMSTSREHNGTRNANLPIEIATIRNKLADIETQNNMVKLVEGSTEDVQRKDLYRILLDTVDYDSDTDLNKSKARLYSLIFGTSVWYEGVFTRSRTTYVPKVDSSGKITGTPKTVTYSWLGGEPIPLDNVWVDPSPSIEKARDCFIMQTDVSYDDVRALEDDPNYIKENVQAYRLSLGKGDGIDTTNNQQIRSYETGTAGKKGKYNLLHYYNAVKGLYIVTDSQFKFILRYGVTPFPHGELPISFLVDHNGYETMYGIGECELLQSNKHERNVIRTQILDVAQASNNINLALGENVTFKKSKLYQGAMKIWNFSGSLSDAQFLKPPGQDSSLFNVESLLKEDSTWITGVDNNALMGSPTKTAYEAKLQEYNKLKGVGQYVRNFDYFWTRVMRQRLQNIQFFMPYTTGKKIIGDAKANKYRIIPLKDKKVDGMHTAFDVKEKDGMRNVIERDIAPKITQNPGKTEFLELDPKYIQDSMMDVRVETVSTTPILRELMSQELDMFINNLVQLSQAIPSIGEKLQMINVDSYIDMKTQSLAVNAKELFEETEEVSEEAILGEFMAQFPSPYQASTTAVPTPPAPSGFSPVPTESLGSPSLNEPDAPLVTSVPEFLQQKGSQTKES